MKKTFFVLSAFCLCSFSWAQTKSENAMFTEINSAYSSGAYPQVIQAGIQFEKNYPNSTLLPHALCQQGESYFKLGRYSEAEKVLIRAKEISGGDNKLKNKSSFFLARSYSMNGKNIKAVNEFYYLLENCEENDPVYYSGLMFAARNLFKIGEYKNAEGLYEKIISSGNKYSRKDFEDCFVDLFNVYSEIGQNEKLVDLYNSSKNKLKDNDSFSDFYSKLTILAGEAYEKLGNYKKAYDCYIEVLLQKNNGYNSVGLQKAYLVASTHSKEVGQNPSSVLNSITVKDKLLLAEFWTRLAIDSFNENKYNDAQVFFKNAKECDDKKEYQALAGIYVSKMAKENPEIILEQYRNENSVDENHELFLDYEILSAQFYAQKKSDEQIQKALMHGNNAYSLLQNTTDARKIQAAYWFGFALWKNSDYGNCLKILKENLPDFNSDDSLCVAYHLLYAKCLAVCSNDLQTINSFEQISRANKLTEKDLADYSIVLFSRGYINSTYNAAVLSNDATESSSYMTALALFNRGDIRGAQEFFEKYLKQKSGSKKDYAEFYLGYCQYKNGQILAATKTLSLFIKKYPEHNLIWNACMTNVQAAVQNNDFDTAVYMAELAVEKSQKNAERHNSVILCSSVYVDRGEFDKAVKLLESESKIKSDDSLKILFLLAQVYSKQQKTSESDKVYSKIIKEYSSDENNSGLVEEAYYRRGEIFYAEKNYYQAISRFKDYQKKFPAGKFIDASYYYVADSLSESSRVKEGIIQYKLLLDSFPESEFVYSSQKKLMEIYFDEKNYSESLIWADLLVKNFYAESKEDGVIETQTILKRLVSGEAEEIVTLNYKFEAAGGINSLKGRILGTELAEELWKRGQIDDSVLLANSLNKIQKQNSVNEGIYLARTSLIIADSLRSQNSSSKAAMEFLECAKLFGQNGNGELAARSLYSAVEAFVSCDMNADAKSTYNKLVELYPENSFSKKAADLIK